MAEQIKNLIAKWDATWPSPLVVSRQHDNGQFRINLVDYPEPENYENQNEEILETINYYLVVWMKQSEDGEMEKLAPIQLPGPYWLVNSPYTQLVQDIKFQFYATSSVTGYIAHSAQFKGMILESLSGSQQQSVIPEEMWDAYKQYIEDKIIGAGLATIDPTLSISGAAADAKATGDAIANVNGRLQELHETIYKEIVDEKSGTYSATAGSPIPSQTHLVDVSIPNGAAYKFVLHADGIVSKYGLYANGTAVQYSLIPETEYELTAATDITWLSIYTTADFVTGSGTVTGVVTTTTLNENSLESKVESVGEETINALTNPFELSTADLEDGAIQNGTGIDFASQRRVRTKTYIPATKGTVITCTRGINVWEYDLLTKQYLTDYGDFTYSYTVENDCCIRIMWNAVKTTAEDYTHAELIALTTLGLMTLRNPLIDQSFIKELAVNVVSDEVVFRSQKSNTVKTIAHRGDDILAPQCTAPAYILARKHGHDIAENDLWLSEDGEFVMWHDTSLTRLGNMVDINGYLMYTDGTDYYWVHPTTNAVYTWNGSDYVSSGVALSGLDRCNGTYYGVNSQYSVTGLPLSILKRIDFGVYKGAKFAGTQILTFAEWVLLCKQLGMEIYIDRKLTYTDALLTQAANIVKRYGMGDYASWLGLTTSQITLLRSIIPDSRCGILQHPTAATAQQYQSYNIGRGFFFNGDAKNGMTAETIQTGLDAGFDVEVWYIDYGNATKEQVFNVLRSAIQYGVTGITTDHYRTDEAFDFLFDTM